MPHDGTGKMFNRYFDFEHTRVSCVTHVWLYRLELLNFNPSMDAVEFGSL